MNYTIFSPENQEIINSLMATYTIKEYPRVINFISIMYVSHKSFDSDDSILSNQHLFKSMHSGYLRKILGRYYTKIIQSLENLKFLEVDRIYCPKRWSHSYRLSQRILANKFTKTGEVSRPRVEKERDEVISKMAPVYQRILSDTSELKFDLVPALKHIENDLSLNSLQRNWYSNFAILAQRGDFTSKDCEQGRLHYMLTVCPRKLRRFFRIRRGNLVLIDINASQVLLHSALYPADCEEKTKFVETCSSGKFWTVLNSALAEPYDLKEAKQKREFKEECFQKIFYTKKDYFYTNSPLVRAFKRLWPQLHQLILDRKAQLKSEGKNLACKMQTLESKIVMFGTVAPLQEKYPDNIFLTIHDCIICEDRMVPVVKNFLSRAMVTEIGVEPGLSVEPMPPFEKEISEAEWRDILSSEPRAEDKDVEL